ncbi:hypothetical protein CH333_03085 [candidate division WOR-3 bacterium JGI_Cruoil_03_44_89]|uniref:Uncharacterized protein n=1 Tax=candidate division WOR-3 bacterium JGI_Cruoil_03_44_89 TaxID=1973748 RepID=A0A235BW22_UNCW3|nr:MAG: hypothetical protein CH333_03085 [candidate division WOR-3 bacterium JGI_Cruoil_03_44_89]
MRGLIFVSFLTMALFAGCDYILDITQPTVKIVKPQEGERVIGIVEIEVEVSDNEEVDKVEFYLGGEFVADTSISEENVSYFFPYRRGNDYPCSEPYRADSSLHDFKVRAYDKAGNWNESEVKNVKVVSIAELIYAGYIFYDSDTIPNPGDTIKIKICLKNIGSKRLNYAELTLSANDNFIAIGDGAITYSMANWVYPGDIICGPSGWEDYVSFNISNSCPPGHIIPFYIDVQDNEGHSWSDEFDMEVY